MNDPAGATREAQLAGLPAQPADQLAGQQRRYSPQLNSGGRDQRVKQFLRNSSRRASGLCVV